MAPKACHSTAKGRFPLRKINIGSVETGQFFPYCIIHTARTKNSENTNSLSSELQVVADHRFKLEQKISIEAHVILFRSVPIPDLFS